MLSDFAVFILTHGRPEKVYTYATLRRSGYTGRVYFVVDNEDHQLDAYRAHFGEQVLVFDKAAVAATFDQGDTSEDRRCVVYARNACFALARALDIPYFLELDDDYTHVAYHFDAAYHVLQPKLYPVHDLDTLFVLVLGYYKAIPALSLAFLQGGDLLGGKRGGYSKSVRMYRKAMNSFFCSIHRPFTFVGRINEDVNTYTSLASRGLLFLSLNQVDIEQRRTQMSAGGMTEVYMASGTYLKSFFPVMYQPSSVRIELMRSRNARLHHRIEWRDTAPCIMAETHCKRAMALQNVA